MKASYRTVKQIYNIWDLIIKEFGQSSFYTWVPQLIIYYNGSKTSKCTYGEFCTVGQDISINLAAHNTIKQAVSTILHEYCHYLQHPGWYTRYAVEYYYYNHPYEVAARKFSSQHLDKFI